MSEVALISGANRGLGWALTEAWLAAGGRVIAGARSASGRARLKSASGADDGRLLAVALDVSDPDSVCEAMKAATAWTDCVDVLINNAGVYPEGGDEGLEASPDAWFRDAFEVNVLGAARLTRAALPLLRRSARPRIVNLSSGAASISTRSDHRRYCYGASKAALNHLTRGMANEFRPEGIVVAALSPGWVRTDMGGPDADLAPEESAGRVVRAVQGLTPERAGLFLDCDGAVGSYAW